MARIVYLRGGAPVFAPEAARVVVNSDYAKPHIVLGGVEFKHCPRCNSWRRLSKFHNRERSWDGLQDMCVTCRGDANADNSKRVRRPLAGAGKFY
jgi:hypothetical protein